MNYMIATTARARSTILTRYMKQVDAGYPDIWLNAWFNRERDYYNYEELCAFIRKQDHDGHLGMRITWDALRSVCEVHNVSAKQFIEDTIPNPKWIYFTRNNVKQVTEALFYECVQKFDDPLDFVPIKDLEAKLTRYAEEEAAWESLFRSLNVFPHRLTCEALLSDTKGALKDVLDFLGIDTFSEDISLMDLNHEALTNHPEVEAWQDAVLSHFLEKL